MKNYLFVLLLLCSASFTYGQIGLVGGYKNFAASDWLSTINTIALGEHEEPNGFAFGVDYRIRMPNIRIEFYPTLSYSSLNNEQQASNLAYTLYAFHLNSRIYPFDLEGDCDCPTWSKSGGLFEKGFFFQLSPGINNMNILFNYVTDIDPENEWFWDIGAGAGIDIGLSERLTLTPMVNFHFSPNATWKYLEPLEGTEQTVQSNVSQLYAALRLGFHLTK